MTELSLSSMTEQALSLLRAYDEVNERRYGRVWSTEELMLGFTGDVGDLSRLVIAKGGVRQQDDLDQKIAHELVDCLWSVLVLADRFGVDLSTEITKNLSDLHARVAATMARLEADYSADITDP
jgi:NTP pyrophosphatase (non-canonical NTP hydrolase)